MQSLEEFKHATKPSAGEVLAYMKNALVKSMRLISIWLVEIIVLLIIINFVSMGILHLLDNSEEVCLSGGSQKDLSSTRKQYRYRLPNYANKERAKLHFQELLQLKSEYRPFVGWSLIEFFGETINIDASGDRVHEHRLPSHLKGPSGVVRFFGGSSMWGVGVVDANTIPALFNRLNPEMEVHNHGEFSFNSRQELARLINLIAEGQEIGTVVFYDGVNEVAVHCRGDTGTLGHNRENQIRTRIKEHPELVRKLRMKELPYLDALWRVFLSDTAKLINILVNAAIGRAEAALPENHWVCDIQPEKAKKVAENLLRNWETAHAVVTGLGHRFYALLQPVSYIGDPATDHITEEMDYYGPELRAQYETVYPLIVKLIEQRGHDWIRIATDLFDGDEYFYIDFSHVTRNGNEKVVSFINEMIHKK